MSRRRRGSEIGGPILARVVGEIEDVFASVERIGRLTADILRTGHTLRDLRPLYPLVAEILARHDGLTVGAGAILAPGVLSDAPRWLEWWRFSPGAAPDRLRVNLDPRSFDYFDYTTAEWYTVPEREGHRWVAGPYVDCLCTNEYTFTLAVPIRLDGVFVGVAGADVLAAHVETEVLPELCRLGRAAVLATADGRVIASNTSTWSSGRLLPAGFVPGGTGRPVPWSVVAVDDL
ncbi:MAG TPA: cache domain-containing protein [Pseudonocardiaceae bacterium]|nr:cache domain-containing protein [Pseudonocardiaceae bacterium]